MTQQGTHNLSHRERSIINDILERLSSLPDTQHIDREWCASLIDGVMSVQGIWPVIRSLQAYLSRDITRSYLRRMRNCAIARTGVQAQRNLQHEFARRGFADTWPTGTEPLVQDIHEQVEDLAADVPPRCTLNGREIIVQDIQMEYAEGQFPSVTITGVMVDRFGTPALPGNFEAATEQITTNTNTKTEPREPKRRRRSVEL